MVYWIFVHKWGLHTTGRKKRNTDAPMKSHLTKASAQVSVGQ